MSDGSIIGGNTFAPGDTSLATGLDPLVGPGNANGAFASIGSNRGLECDSAL